MIKLAFIAVGGLILAYVAYLVFFYIWSQRNV